MVKHFLITGGTGSFGKAMVAKLLKSDGVIITVFSRDEDKQEQMRRMYPDESIHYIVGDVSDFTAINRAMYGVDYVFHAAALKQVPSCEENPMEAIATNLYGSNNVFHAAVLNGVKSVVALSTDKACYPINTMGQTKALMEKLAINWATQQQRRKGNTAFRITRYGNVAGSRGSVIPLFLDQMKQGKLLTITDPTMTRFFMSMEDALNLVFHAWETEYIINGSILVYKAPAVTIYALAQAICLLFNREYDAVNVGVRPGEKQHETLLTQEEMERVVEATDYYMVAPWRSQIDPSHQRRAFTSDRAKMLTVPQIVGRLRDLDFVQAALNA